MIPSMLTTREIAKVLNIPLKTAQKFCRDGRIKATLIGKEYRVKEEDLIKFIDGESHVDKDVPHN